MTTTADTIMALADDYVDQVHRYRMGEAPIGREKVTLRTAVESLVADAERYRLLAPRLLAADFEYGDPPTCVIVFEWPNDAQISADLGASIDAALRGQP